MPETLDFISFVPWTFIVMIANVYILYRLVKRILFKRVQAVLEKRQQEVDGIYAEAKLLKEESSKAKNQYEEQLSKAHAKAVEVIEIAVSNAKLQEKDIIRQAHEEAEHLLHKAQRDIEQTEKKAAAQLRKEVSLMAVSIAGKVVQKEISFADHEKLIDECIERLEEDAV